MVFKLRGKTRKKLALSIKKMSIHGWKKGKGKILVKKAKDGHKYYEAHLIRKKG